MGAQDNILSIGTHSRPASEVGPSDRALAVRGGRLASTPIVTRRPVASAKRDATRPPVRAERRQRATQPARREAALAHGPSAAARSGSVRLVSYGGYADGAAGRSAVTGGASNAGAAAGTLADAPGFGGFADDRVVSSRGAGNARRSPRESSHRGSAGRAHARRASRTVPGEGPDAGAASAGRRASGASALTGGVGAARNVAAFVGDATIGFGARLLSHRALLVVLAALVVIAAMLYSPLQASYVARRTNATLSSRLDSVNASNSVLQDEVNSLMTREGIEDAARERGYVTEGDNAVNMSGVDEGTDASEASSLNSEPADPDLPWYVDALDFVFQYDAESQGVG